MTVKEFLNSVRTQEQEAIAIEEECKKIEYEIYGIKGLDIKEKVQSSHKGDLSELVERHEQAMEKVVDEWNALMSLREDAKRIIAMLADPDQRAILRRRYILYQKWELIAVETHQDLRWVYRLHGRALQELENTPEAKLTVANRE